MQLTEFKKVHCPDINCKRTIAHYLEGDNSKYSVTCPRCKKTILIYSAGQTAVLIESKMIETKIEINIKF